MHALHLYVAVHRLNISYHRLQHCTQSDTWKAVGSCWKAVGSCWKSVGVAWSPTGPQPKQHQHQWIGQHQCLAGAIPDCRIRTVHAAAFEWFEYSDNRHIFGFQSCCVSLPTRYSDAWINSSHCFGNWAESLLFLDRSWYQSPEIIPTTESYTRTENCWTTRFD